MKHILIAASIALCLMAIALVYLYGGVSDYRESTQLAPTHRGGLYHPVLLREVGGLNGKKYLIDSGSIDKKELFDRLRDAINLYGSGKSDEDYSVLDDLVYIFINDKKITRSEKIDFLISFLDGFGSEGERDSVKFEIIADLMYHMKPIEKIDSIISFSLSPSFSDYEAARMVHVMGNAITVIDDVYRLADSHPDFSKEDWDMIVRNTNKIKSYYYSESLNPKGAEHLNAIFSSLQVLDPEHGLSVLGARNNDLSGNMEVEGWVQEEILSVLSSSDVMNSHGKDVFRRLEEKQLSLEERRSAINVLSGFLEFKSMEPGVELSPQIKHSISSFLLAHSFGDYDKESIDLSGEDIFEDYYAWLDALSLVSTFEPGGRIDFLKEKLRQAKSWQIQAFILEADEAEISAVLGDHGVKSRLQRMILDKSLDEELRSSFQVMLNLSPVN